MRPGGRTDRLIDLKMFFLKYPVCVISVAGLVAVDKQPLFLLVFAAFCNGRSIFLIQ